MAFSDVTIPGASGVISTHYSFWKGFRYSVDGQPVKLEGFPRNRLTLQGESGPVEVKVKGNYFRAYPAFVVGDTEYLTGPATPRGFQIAAMLPLLALLLVQGVIGVLVAFGGVAVNMGILRGENSGSAKVALMVATLVSVLTIDIVAATAITNAVGS